MSLTVPSETLLELEYALSEPQFMGVPIGSTLGSIFYLQLFLGHRKWDALSVSTDWLRFWYHYLLGVFPKRQQPTISQHNKGRVLLTLTNNRPHMRELVIPVASRLGVDRCTILVPGSHSGFRSLTGFEYISINSLPYDHSVWRKEFLRCYPKWRACLREYSDRNRLPRYILPSLDNALVVQTQRIVAYHEMLDALTPLAIVTEFDRSHLFSGLVLSAKSRQIPTMTMMHGVINPPYGYVPLLADIAFCWGQESFDQMVAMGTDSSRLVIAGCQRVTPALQADRETARAKFNVTDTRPLVLLASSMVSPIERKRFVRYFCDAFSGKQHIAAAVRLHPSENLQFYAEEIRHFPSIIFTEARSMSQDEALAAADIIVNRASGFGNEAILKGKPVVVFDVIDAPLGNASTLIEYAGCPHVKSGDQLSEIVEQIISDYSFQKNLLRQGQKFIKYQFSAFGEAATENIVNKIVECTKCTVFMEQQTSHSNAWAK